MDYDELFDEYQKLLTENKSLKEENKILKALLTNSEENMVMEKVSEDKLDKIMINKDEADCITSSHISNKSDSMEKIKLFMSLFRGRNDVFARGWPNKKTGKYGYSPCCLNERKYGLCIKPKGNCKDCINKSYAALDEKVIDNHLRGNIVVGLYPMCPDECCYFVAIDFDKGEWQKDVAALRSVCSELDIPVAVEKSRSGNGCHVWFFFEDKLPAATARKFGTALLTYCMNVRHEIAFDSYDRLFPNQDTMPKGGLGNLIALPLQKAARSLSNSEFIDENYNSYEDQWAFLSSIRKLNQEDIKQITYKLCGGNELGALRKDEEENPKPWENVKFKLSSKDFPQTIDLVKANMLYIPRAGINQRALNHLRRLAAFKNPEFYKAQAMRMYITKKMNRIIDCSVEDVEYLGLPRGCEADVIGLLREYGTEANIIDRTNSGKRIDVEFVGSLRDDQPLALNKLLEHDTGVLCGTTAFGKTVVAIKMIAERKVNTLILVNKVSLVEQWRNRLLEFLKINEKFDIDDEQEGKKIGRKKNRSIIGQIGSGKDNLNGIIDIGVMQSLYRNGEVRDCVKNYGMIIIDECHHISAFSFEEILKSVNAKYVLGLTATPSRKDGHHPIIFMQCGPIRYRDDAKRQAEKRPFDHYVIPRFTSLRNPIYKEGEDITINDIYAEITVNELRNQLIVSDVISCCESGRNCIVLTERTAHVETLAKMIGERVPDVISLTGGMSARESSEATQLLASIPKDKSMVIVATGKYIGEGFDEPRLDTLFLAMPISWKGTLQQYAGRLHRLFDGKNEVQIHDYVDIHVRMLEKMYTKRFNGYAAIGYKAKGERNSIKSLDVIYDRSNFITVYADDLTNALREIIIVSPFITKKRILHMVDYLNIPIQNGVKVVIITRPPDSYNQKDRAAIEEVLDSIKGIEIKFVFLPNLHQKFAVIDQKIVWYGSINLLGYGNAEESIMRLESSNIADELMKSI